MSATTAEDKAPVRVRPAADVEIAAPATPADYMRSPFAIGTAIKHETAIRIEAIEDEEEAKRRFLATREGVNAGIIVVGPGGGEAWHTHLTYYDVVLYIRSGRVEVSWDVEGEIGSTVATTGDFVFIEPSIRHQWLNVGEDDLELVWFMHFHNY